MTKEEYWKNYYSDTLCEYFSDKFDTWWDKDNFNLEYVKYLLENIPYKITSWYILNKLDINIINNLEWYYE